MNDFSKISYYDLRWEHQHNRLPIAVGFEMEAGRLNRIIGRQMQHHAILSAPSGTGKTALLFAWAKQAIGQPTFSGLPIILLDTSSLQKIGQLPTQVIQAYQDAFLSIEKGVLILDSFGEMVFGSPSALQTWNTLLKPLLLRPGVSVILAMQPEELAWIKEHKSHFLAHFEILTIHPPKPEDCLEIVKNHFSKATISQAALEASVTYAQRFPSLGQLPKSAISLIDEALAETRFTNASENQKVEVQDVLKIVAEKTGVPLQQLTTNDLEKLKTLQTELQARVKGQKEALEKITSVIQRARLGLKNQNRPLASFLVLGPSGTGKTETAKSLAELLYGTSKSFLRIDMSEFSQEHSVARLTGAPAGYVGYEAGGQLTNHLKNHLYSLVLLDEIEKAHSKAFDIFLQLLDDGRLTSGKGETVDATQSIFLATSNLCTDAIITAWQSGRDIGSEDFVKTELMPHLLQHFRMEFLNRFDAILIFRPLSVEALTDIALLEISKIEERVKHHRIAFNITREALGQKIHSLADPRFGARPIKRFIEETCENLIAETLLKN